MNVLRLVRNTVLLTTVPSHCELYDDHQGSQVKLAAL